MQRRAISTGFLFLAASLALAQEKDLDTPYVPTPQVVVSRMLELAQIKPGDTVIDLGSGDGRLVITAAQKYGARGFGVELDPRLVERSNAAAARAGVADRVKFLQQDLFQTDFHQANVLTLYLLPDVNMALRPKILEELKPGTRVVSHDYGMREWRPDAQEIIPAPDKTVGARKESMVYLWVVPAKVEGDWDLEIAADGVTRHIPLSVEQEFQVVSAAVYVLGHGRVPASDARLRGDALSLTLPAGVLGPEQVELRGRALGDSLSGRVREGDREIGTWSARRQR
jgi:SAM-dependent methyltransferase